MKIQAKSETILLKLIVNRGGFSSTSGARKLIKNRNVSINGKVQNIPATLVKKGDVVEIIFSKKGSLRTNKKKFPFDIIYEGGTIKGFEKPSGMPIHTNDKKLDSVLKLIRRWLDNNPDEEEQYVINKIDKRESGIVLTTTDFRVKKQFENDSELLEKRYYVLTDGYPKYKEDTLVNRLKKNKIGLLYESKDKIDTVVARMNYRIMNATEEYALLKVNAETDVKNQIRAQLSIHKTPIIGDKKYKCRSNPLKRLGIHLFSLGFIHPETNEKVEVKTQVPRSFIRLSKGRLS